MKFKDFVKLDGILEESTFDSVKISFLDHLEELAISYGREGFNQFEDHVLNFLNFLTGLSSKTQVGIKIDGNPCIFFGEDPRPDFKSQFFVATKAALNISNPKINHTKEDIIQNYEDIPLANKLIACLDAFYRIWQQLKNEGHEGLVYQGDLLFSLPGDKQVVDINGTNFITFRPNMIVYAVPVDMQSELYARVADANVGIILHEVFKAEVISGGNAIRIVPIGKNFNEIIEQGKVHKVFIEDSVHPTVNLQVNIERRQKINSYLQKCKDHMSEITESFDKEWKASPLLALLKSYLNYQIKNGGGIFKNALTNKDFDENIFKNGFKKWISNKFVDEAGKKITDKGKISTLARRDALFEWIDQNVYNFNHLLHATYLMLLIKNEFISITNESERKLGKTFYQLPDGSYEVTPGEGFVLFTGNSKVKLVDRISFSQRNFKNQISHVTEGVDLFEDEKEKKFTELANAQRGTPESKMLAATYYMQGGVINPVLEHVGDLTHRMAQRVVARHGRGWEYVKEKIWIALKYLNQRYGFEKEFEENIINNAKYRGIDPKVLREKLFILMQEYADAHKELVTYNKVQTLARDAAIMVGERRFVKAALYLEELQKIVDQGEDIWAVEASKFEGPNKYDKKIWW